MSLSIVMPSIDGREDELARTVAAHEKKTSVDIEWIFEYNHPNVGTAWNAGAQRATGTYIYFSGDDLEPESDAWFPAAKGVIDDGNVPLGWVREDIVGTFGRDFTRVPMCHRDWWYPVPEIHYYSDNAFGLFMRVSGHIPTVAPGFDFYHRRSLVGRDDSPPRVGRDHDGFQEWRSVIGI